MLGQMTITLTLGPVDATATSSTHVDVGGLSPRRAAAMRRLVEGMAGNVMADGKRVHSPADVVRWILDQVAEAPEGERE